MENESDAGEKKMGIERGWERGSDAERRATELFLH